MDDKSTRVQSDDKLFNMLVKSKGASKSTLDYLKMLARSYHVEASLPEAFNATCMN